MACSGIFPLFALAHGLVPEGIQLTYPEQRAQTPIYLAGKYTLRGLAHAIEQQTECQAMIRHKIITLLFPKNNKFTLIEPNVFTQSGGSAAPNAPGAGTTSGIATTPSTSNTGQTGTIPGDTISTINGFAIIQGNLDNLSVTRRILSKLLQPPKQIRLTAILVNDSLSNDIDLQVTPGTNPISLSSLNDIWAGATATINVLHQRGAIVTAYQAILTAGETENYTDTDQRVIQQYSTTGQTAGAGLLQSGIDTRSAGLTITVTANPGPGYWTINGSVGNSTFNGSSALADELSNAISWTSTIAPGEMERVTQVTVNQTTHTIGVSTNQPTFDHDHGWQTFSLWVRLQEIKPQKIVFINRKATK